MTVNAMVPTVNRLSLTALVLDDSENTEAMRDGFPARVPKGPVGEPKDPASSPLFMASWASDSDNGHILHADGGDMEGW